MFAPKRGGHWDDRCLAVLLRRLKGDVRDAPTIAGGKKTMAQKTTKGHHSVRTDPPRLSAIAGRAAENGRV